MASLTYELVWWPTNEKFQKDPTIINPEAVNILKKKTPHQFWLGTAELHTGEPGAFGIIGWDKSDSHKAFCPEPLHATLIEYLSVSFKNAGTRDIVSYGHFKADPASVCEGTATSLSWLTPKGGVTREKAESVLESIAGPSVVWGTVEATEKFVVLEKVPQTAFLPLDRPEFLEIFTIEKDVLHLDKKQ